MFYLLIKERKLRTSKNSVLDFLNEGEFVRAFGDLWYKKDKKLYNVTLKEIFDIYLELGVSMLEATMIAFSTKEGFSPKKYTLEDLKEEYGISTIVDHTQPENREDFVVDNTKSLSLLWDTYRRNMPRTQAEFHYKKPISKKVFKEVWGHILDTGSLSEVRKKMVLGTTASIRGLRNSVSSSGMKTSGELVVTSAKMDFKTGVLTSVIKRTMADEYELSANEYTVDFNLYNAMELTNDISDYKVLDKGCRDHYDSNMMWEIVTKSITHIYKNVEDKYTLLRLVSFLTSGVQGRYHRSVRYEIEGSELEHSEVPMPLVREVVANLNLGESTLDRAGNWFYQDVVGRESVASTLKTNNYQELVERAGSLVAVFPLFDRIASYMNNQTKKEQKIFERAIERHWLGGYNYLERSNLKIIGNALVPNEVLRDLLTYNAVQLVIEKFTRYQHNVVAYDYLPDKGYEQEIEKILPSLQKESKRIGEKIPKYIEDTFQNMKENMVEDVKNVQNKITPLKKPWEYIIHVNQGIWKKVMELGYFEKESYIIIWKALYENTEEGVPFLKYKSKIENKLLSESSVLANPAIQASFTEAFRAIGGYLERLGRTPDEFIKVINYLSTDCTLRQRMSLRNATVQYRDYINSYVALNLLDLNEAKRFDLCPFSLKLAHDITTSDYQTMQDSRADEFMVARYNIMPDGFSLNNRKFSIDKEEYVLVQPKGVDDLKAEGSSLNHCVGTYAARIIKGDNLIYMLRKKDSIEESYLTIEILVHDDSRVSLGHLQGESYRSKIPTKITDKLKEFVVKVNEAMLAQREGRSFAKDTKSETLVRAS